MHSLLPSLNTNTTTTSSSFSAPQNPSPLSATSSHCPSIFDSSPFDQPHAPVPIGSGRRESSGSSMTSCSDRSNDGVFKPPDAGTIGMGGDPIVRHDSSSSHGSLVTTSTLSSAHRVATPEADSTEHLQTYLLSSSQQPRAFIDTAIGQTKDQVAPRAANPAPMWPLTTGVVRQDGPLSSEPEVMDIDEPQPPAAPTSDLRPTSSETTYHRKFASLDSVSKTPATEPFHDKATPMDRANTHGGPSTARWPTLATAGFPPARDSRAKSTSPVDGAGPNNNQKVIAHSTATGCLISAPISPPAHYPGSAAGSRRGSANRNSTEIADSPAMRRSSSSTRQNSARQDSPAAPLWAHPPQQTNKISGRAWSFSQGQERPNVDFDPELFSDADPDAVQEIIKGVEGRIAVKTTPTEYSIMAWLPGFSINDIVISMKGNRTVQIVADLWDEEDHAQWNIVLGEDLNRSAIAAKFQGNVLLVTVQRKPRSSNKSSNRSARSAFSSWSAPAAIDPQPSISSMLASTHDSDSMSSRYSADPSTRPDTVHEETTG